VAGALIEQRALFLGQFHGLGGGACVTVGHGEALVPVGIQEHQAVAHTGRRQAKYPGRFGVGARQRLTGCLT